MLPFSLTYLYVILPPLAGAIFLVFYFVSRLARRRLFLDSLKLTLLAIRITQKPLKESAAEGKPADFKQEIKLSEELVSALAGFKKPFILEAAVPHIGEEIHFYLAIRREFAGNAMQHVQSLWPEAQIITGDDYNIFQEGGADAASYLQLKSSFAIPLRTYEDVGDDTFKPILGGLSKIKEIGEGAAIQVLVRPAGSHYKKVLNRYFGLVKKGQRLSEVVKYPVSLLTLPNPEKAIMPDENIGKPPAPIQIDQESLNQLEKKSKTSLFDVNVRLVASAAEPFQAQSILEGLESTFNQMGGINTNSFRIVKPRNIKNLICQFSFREFDPKQSMILTGEELTSIFHLPVSSTNIPKIKWLKSKEAPPPADLQTKGVQIGESSFRGESKPIFITDDDRRRHIYIVGQTGTGKSTLLTNMAADDIKQGKGTAVLDPHGDLIHTIMTLVPKERIEDVILFDPSDFLNPVGLNMLEYNFARPEEKTFIVNELFSIFDKLYDLKLVGGPMFEQYMKNALFLLMEDMPNEPATLMEIARVFTDDEFRKEKLARIKNPTVIDFWEKEALKATGEHSLANMAPYITSKFNNFTANDYMRPIIGQPKSSFNFREVIDGGKILLINLSKGRIGDVNANLLGMIIVGRILMAALARADTPQEKRKDFNLYIDEFQNFTTESIAIILSEARKYKLNLTIAHQFIAQLTDKIRGAVFGNVGSIIAFRVGAPDAEVLVKQFEPVFNQSDLVNIDNFNAYVKMLVKGETAKPFNIKTLPPEKGDPEMVELLKQTSGRKYGRPRETVETEIYKRLRE